MSQGIGCQGTLSIGSSARHPDLTDSAHTVRAMMVALFSLRALRTLQDALEFGQTA